jgi:ubiquinone/menaquinone biosynthesis C-methylase UbiE
MDDVDKFARFYESGFGKLILEKEAEYVRQELQDCGRILDVGCGIGVFEERLYGLDVTGLDISEEMIKVARRRSRKNFVVGDAGNLDFDDATFDGVFYVATLEFIADYKKAVREAWRVTRQGGKLLVLMLNPESQYFHEQSENKDSYFRRALHRDVSEVRDYISEFYAIIKEEYFLGIRGKEVFETRDKNFAAMYAVVGKRIEKNK